MVERHSRQSEYKGQMLEGRKGFGVFEEKERRILWLRHSKGEGKWNDVKLGK